MSERRTSPPRLFVAGLLLVLSSPLLAVALSRVAPALRLDIGPGDRDYVQGLSSRWRWEGGAAWRTFERRGRVYLPATVEGPGSFSMIARHRGPGSARLRVHFDDDTSYEITLEPSSDWRRIAFELPSERVRAHVRLRFESSGAGGTLEIRRVEWSAERAWPQREVILAVAVFLLGPFLASVLAGAGFGAGAAASLASAAALVLWSAFQPFVSLHLVLASVPVVASGVAVIALARLAGLGLSAPFFLLFFFTFLLRAGALFHPSFYFYDIQVHETLLELLYHRGFADFWSHWPDYQVTYGVGVSLFEGERRAFLYPVAFHTLAHVGNTLWHAPVFWLKLMGSLLSALALFPIGYLARRVFPVAGADFVAGALYVLVPVLARDLLLLKFAAVTGHLFDVTAVAFLAHVALRLDAPARWVGGSLLIAASLATYNSGFIHMGLLIGSSLLLAPLLGGLTKRRALGLATAGLMGLAVALVSYHPEGIRNFLSALFVEKAEPSPTLEEPGYSITGMTLDSLGIPLLVVGSIGAATVARSLPLSLRLLLCSWFLSAAFAHGLRYVFPELLTYQKELYWAGAALSVTGGVLLARACRRGRSGYALAILAVLAVAGAWLWSLQDIIFRFYGPYLFL